ncbi:TPA: phage tail fiber protein [Enterobacter hormaechei]
MSVPNQTPYIIYNANGLTTVFPFEFYIINAGDIQVSINGTPVSSGYSVSGVGNVTGGDVIFITPPAAGTVVMLERVVPTYRLTDYQDNGDLLADTVNKDFDRLWMAIQRSFIYLGLALRRPLLGGPFNAEGYRIEKLADPVNPQDAATKRYIDNVSLVRALRVPESSIPTLAPAEHRANKLLGFNSAGDPVFVSPPSGSASDVMLQLAASDGYKYIGECPDISTLRSIEPTTLGQLIRVKNYYSDKFGGGGFFRSVNPGSLVEDGGLYIKTSGGAVWRRCVKNKQVSTEEYGCWDGNTGSDNSARLLKACASGLDVKMMGENYNVVSIPSSRFSLTGRMKASTADFSTAYGRTLLTLTGANVTYDIDIDMQNFGAGGFINQGTDTVGRIKVSNIYGANRTTYGLQNAVTDEGIRNTISAIIRNIQKGDTGVDPQPAAFTVGATTQRGNYPDVNIYDSQGGVIVAATTETVFGVITARLIHDNGIYCLEGSRVSISEMVVDNGLGEPVVNAGGIVNIGVLRIRECSGYGITYSYSGTMRIDALYIDNTLSSSIMPILRSRPDNVSSTIRIGRIEGACVLAGVTASILHSMFSITQGVTDLYIGDVNLRVNYVTGSYLGMADFAGCSRIQLGNWTIDFNDTTGTLTSASIAYFSLPSTAQFAGSQVGYQNYRSTTATVRMTNIGNDTIDFAVGQAVQVNAGPYISSAISANCRIFHAAAVPTAGKWYSGDKIFIITPGTSVKLGWVCTQSGDFSGTAPTFQLMV